MVSGYPRLPVFATRTQQMTAPVSGFENPSSRADHQTMTAAEAIASRARPTPAACEALIPSALRLMKMTGGSRT